MEKEKINYGGKGDSLVQLQKNNFNVPDFFIVSSTLYKTFLEENNILSKIIDLFKVGNVSEIKDLIMKNNLNNNLLRMLEKEFKNLNTDLVSVRSSASNEDGTHKSFAGQYSTFLNVSYLELEEKIKECWCSLYEENILEYEDTENIYGMNVIIQKMINPEYAGVAFTIDPTTDTNNYSVIEIVKGLGDKLVSGEVTPTKFLVRRATGNIDLTIGNIEIKEDVIKKIEDIILDIEKIYKMPMDIEYAILENKIYILQARPITSITPLPKPYRLSITRPQSLIENEIFYKGEYLGIKKLTNDLYYFKPLFIYDSNKKTSEIYYNDIDLEEDPNQIYRTIDSDYNNFVEYYNVVEEDVQYLENILKESKNVNLDSLIEKTINIVPLISLGQLAGHFENIAPRIKELLVNFRIKYDYIIHQICELIIETINDKLPMEYRDYINFITYDEFKYKQPPIKELKDRKNGYIYFDKLYTTSDYDKWLQKNNINIITEEESNLFGQVAYPGNVTGKVCIIYSELDFHKFEKGDILVTPMTIPKFVKIINKASAIITDEGGITCHACIIARELKIPCIVGCKNATKLLNDRDIIEINGSTGKIKKVYKD